MRGGREGLVLTLASGDVEDFSAMMKEALRQSE